MLPLADTRNAPKRRQPDKEKDDLFREAAQQEKADGVSAYQGIQSELKSHYMYNVPLLPRVVHFLTAKQH